MTHYLLSKYSILCITFLSMHWKHKVTLSVSVCQVCLLLLSCRSVIQNGESYIKVAMTLDVGSQLEIRDMITGLLEPGHHLTDADLTQILTKPRGLVCRLCCIFTDGMISLLRLLVNQSRFLYIGLISDDYRLKVS